MSSIAPAAGRPAESATFHPRRIGWKGLELCATCALLPIALVAGALCAASVPPASSAADDGIVLARENRTVVLGPRPASPLLALEPSAIVLDESGWNESDGLSALKRLSDLPLNVAALAD